MSSTIIVDQLEINVQDFCNYNRDKLLEIYWNFHPRFRFFKSCQRNGIFFDIGASDGELAFWKDWMDPARNDLKLYGVDLKIGEFSDKYERFDTFNLDRERFPYKDDFFTNIYSAHVIEHLKNPEYLIKNIYKKLKVDGMAYIECPNKNSLLAPTKKKFEDSGFITTTMNFFDDSMHIRPYDKDELETMFVNTKLSERGFEIIEKGTVRNDYLSDLLISYGYNNQDKEITTYGLWLKLLWSDYIWIKKL